MQCSPEPSPWVAGDEDQLHTLQEETRYLARFTGRVYVRRTGGLVVSPAGRSQTASTISSSAQNHPGPSADDRLSARFSNRRLAVTALIGLNHRLTA